MKKWKVVFWVLLFYFLPGLVISNAQIELSLQLRSSGFTGSFGQTYIGLGFGTGLTIKPSGNWWAIGFTHSRNWLGSLPMTSYSPYLDVGMKTFNLHTGIKKEYKVFQPFAYALLGTRSITFKDPKLSQNHNPVFSSLSLSCGLKIGTQLGGRNWRAEISTEWLWSPPMKFITLDSIIESKAKQGTIVDYPNKGVINSLCVSVGIARIISFNRI
jgi:hypothetical protein